MPDDETMPVLSKQSNPIVAAGPVSYGAFEITVGKGFWVPDPKDLLDAVTSAGYQGVELGPVGYLGSTDELHDRLLERNLQLAGGYIQLPFSEPDRLARAMPELTALLDTLDAAGPQAKPPKPVLADAGSLLRIQNPGRAAEDRTLGLDKAGWRHFSEGLATVVELCRARGYDPTFHPHAGTFVESGFEIAHLLETSEIGICYDTGHLIIGGEDPLTSIKTWGKRINHIHLKDTRFEVIKRLRSEHAISETYYEGEAFSPLGEGNVALDEVLTAIADLQYSGWLVVEQDVVLKSEKLFSKAVKAQEHSRAYLRKRGL
jgi:inosose dehydratase